MSQPTHQHPMNPRVHYTIDGKPYKAKSRGGRNPLPPEMKLTKRVIGSVTESMRSELNEWIAKGYKETEILNLALRDWLDKQNSVQNTVYH